MNPYRKVRSLPVGHLSYPLPTPADLSDIYASMEYGEKEIVYHLPVLVGGGPILNLGDGGSATLIALSLRNHDLDGHVYTVDCYEEQEFREHRNRRADLGLSDRVTLHRMTTERAKPHLADYMFNLIFVDADHTYEHCRQDFEMYHAQLVPEGLLAFHDVNQDDVDKVIRQHVEKDWQLLFFVNRIKVFRRRAA